MPSNETGMPSNDELARRWAVVHPGQRADSSPLLQHWLRLTWRVVRPLARIGLPADAMTVAGAVAALAAAVAAALGHGSVIGGRWWLAGALLALALSAAADALDGALAISRANGESIGSRHGALLDRSADRIADACWAGVIWGCGAPGWAALALAVGALSQEGLRMGLGDRAHGLITVSERPTRFICTALALICALIDPSVRWPALICAGVWGGATLVALGQLLSRRSR
jgi:phosphatidylglycerophosphate synthase